MTIVKSKPTSPGRRFRVKVSNKDLYKGQPYEPLLTKLNKSGGRNNQGRITTRHIGGGHKKRYSCLLYTSPSPRDATLSRMPSSA